jgi:hypothetical protein
MNRHTRPVSWIKAARKEFEKFPAAAQSGKADIVKPLHGFGSGVFEIALAFAGDAFRVV